MAADVGLTDSVLSIQGSDSDDIAEVYTDSDKVALNVGFYYMANACGRLAGTLLSGVMYLQGGLSWCLWTSAAFVLLTALITLFLPKKVGDAA